MSKELVEELLFPSSELHFACDRTSIWVGAQDVEGDAAQEGKILRAVILAGARIVLVEDDIELPVQLIFHAPVRARHLQQAFGRELSGRHHVVQCVGDLAVRVALGLDAADDGERGEVGRVCGPRQHAGAAALTPVVADIGLLMEDQGVGGIGGGKRLLGAGEQRRVVALELERVMGAARAPPRPCADGNATRRR